MKYSYINIFIIVLLSFLSCRIAKRVSFETPVDTSTKAISIQKRQVFELPELGIYASNQFDGARLNGVKKLNDSTVSVIINPENQPINHSAYYAFKVWSKTPKDFYFEFQYPEEHKHRYLPKLRRDRNWQVMDSTNIFIKDSVVTVKLKLNRTPLTVAAQEINSSSDVKDWVNDLIKGKASYVQHNIYGKSRLGRDLPVLDISIGDKKGKDVVLLLTRQHPPEVTGYFAYQHFLSTLLNDSALSHAFFKKYRVLAFPIMNPDGVDMGHWRHNAGGIDLNRDWSKYNQPEIKQTVTYVTKELKRNKSKLILGLDFHSTYEDVFYTNTIREGTTLPNFIEDWFKALEENIEGYTVNEAPGNSTHPVSKGWFLYGHNAVGITYEIGDATPKDRIQEIGHVTAEQMMHVLLKNN